jgi:hypothetical protein
MLLLSSISTRVSAQTENIIFFDDFESYRAGTFPWAGGWDLVWYGVGPQYQVVTGDRYHSPTRSLQLIGKYGWSSVAERRFTAAARVIGFEAFIRVEGQPLFNVKGLGSIGFWNREKAMWGKYYVDVAFMSDGYLAVHFIDEAGNEELKELQPYTPGRWYKVRVVLDRSANTFSVWIDDELKASNLKTANTYDINALEVSSAWGEVACYFDDIKVFTIEEQGSRSTFFMLILTGIIFTIFIIVLVLVFVYLHRKKSTPLQPPPLPP